MGIALIPFGSVGIYIGTVMSECKTACKFEIEPLGSKAKPIDSVQLIPNQYYRGIIIFQLIQVLVTKVDLHNDIIDGYVNQLDKETNESHDSKPNCSGYSNLLKF